MKEEEEVKIVMGEGIIYQIKAFYNLRPPEPITKEILIKLSKDAHKI